MKNIVVIHSSISHLNFFYELRKKIRNMLSPVTIVAILLFLIVTATPTSVESYPIVKKSLCFIDNISADCNEAFETKILGTWKYRDLNDYCPELLNVINGMSSENSESWYAIAQKIVFGNQSPPLERLYLWISIYVVPSYNSFNKQL